jgi:serine/threonine-protein phosphatase 2A regulatory subunit B'
MVYNAMKMFMEINPQLFDECSHEYTEHQNTADQREKTRTDRWDMIEQQAKDRKNGIPPPPPPALDVPEPIDEVEAMTHESQKRLNTLKLQEEPDTSKERPSREGTPNSVSSVHL